MLYTFKDLAKRLQNLNVFVKNVRKVYMQYKNDIQSEIITLNKGTLLYRIETDTNPKIKNEPHIPLSHYHLVKTVNEQETYRLIKDIRVFKCEINQILDYGYQVHYIVPVLLGGIENLLDKHLILETLNQINCQGTMEQSIFSNNQYEVCVDSKLVQKCIIDIDA